MYNPDTECFCFLDMLISKMIFCLGLDCSGVWKMLVRGFWTHEGIVAGTSYNVLDVAIMVEGLKIIFQTIIMMF